MKHLFFAAVFFSFALIQTPVFAAAQPIPGVDISAKKNPGGAGKKPTVMAPNDSSATATGDSTTTRTGDVSGNVRMYTQAREATAKLPSIPTVQSVSRKDAVADRTMGGSGTGKPKVDTAQPPMTRMFSDECETMCKTKCVCDKPGTQSCYCPIPGLPPPGKE